jgi:pimeloyl-ACP methyl ester carboxylesterase
MKRLIFLVVLLLGILSPIPRAQAAPILELLDRDGRVITAITDGDLVSLRLTLEEEQAADARVSFTLDGAARSVAECTLPAGQSACTTEPFPAYGWYWRSAGVDAQPQPTVLVHATLGGVQPPAASLSVEISPRPVILVHGFLSNASAWANYLGDQGYLAQASIPAYAVGDGQVTGAMKTGDITEPASRTNTIAQNAEILAQYIRSVKAKTGAQQVDLIGHSMGGLISRYYIDRLMQPRDVAQLIMLGTPSSGSDCAILPAALGFYYPTVLEIRSSYMTQVFNQQIKQRHGVPFFALAGTQITTPVGSACTDIPNDMVVSVGSVASINLTHSETPILHVDMNTSAEIFQEYVLPLLQRGAGASWQEPDPALPSSTGESLQFSRVYPGHVNPGERVEHFIELEPGLAVANFALYDPSASLAVTVTGASGKEIVLDAVKNGLLVVDDPATLVNMGYGFENPKPGPWIIRLEATENTPPEGADFALTANLIGGAVLTGNATPLLPKAGETVNVSANLALNGDPLAVEAAVGIVRSEDGTIQPLSVTINGNLIQGAWQPSQPGIHAIDLLVAAKHPNGSGAVVERTAYLTVEVQPGTEAGWGSLSPLRTSLLVGVSVLILLILVVIFRMAYRRVSRSAHKKEE